MMAVVALKQWPYGRHLLKRQAAKVQSKIDVLDLQSLESATLRDGTYTVQGLGYAGDKPMNVTVTIQAGRIADIDVKHSEKIDLGATTILPDRIVAEQSLQVDAVTGATVTCDAIIDAVFRALKQAGLD
jgi:fumarate reductase flavoprotein subunit